MKPKKLYKLTDSNGQTRNGTQWGPNVTHTAIGDINQKLCSDGWIHAYESPLVAVLMNPAHAAFTNPQLWEARGVIGKRDGQRKCGCRSLTTVKQIPLPEVTINQRIRFVILVTKEVCKDEKWNKWADAWLDGSNRAADAAYAADDADDADATDAADAVYAAANAAYAADAAKLNLIGLAERAIREEK